MAKKTLTHYPLLTEDFSPEVVILANGDYPTHPLPLALLARAQFVVCCDGAANEYVNRGFTPHAIVGDSDSLSPENKAKFINIIYYSSDPETNDLTKAINYCISQRKTDIIVLGATGKREDHTIGNISLLSEFMDQVNIQIVTDSGIFTPAPEDATYESYVGQPVSIFSFKHNNPVRARGLEYELGTFNNWWQGTLNKSKSNAFTLLSRGKTVVYRAY